MTSTIMVIGAHHDDNELVSGMLALYSKAGWRVVSVVVTDGKYIRGHVSDAHIAIREQESLTAAKLMPNAGMHCEFLRIPEGSFFGGQVHTIQMIVRAMRLHRPIVVITHPPRDYHSDHEQVSRCVSDAIKMCWNPCVVLPPELDGAVHPPLDRPPFLYWSDPWFVASPEPDEYVDITSTIEVKMTMLGCHRSQMLDPNRPGQEGDMVELARIQSRYRGVEAGTRYAEAFRFEPQLGAVRLRQQCLLSATPDKAQQQ